LREKDREGKRERERGEREREREREREESLLTRKLMPIFLFFFSDQAKS
jgi:hypothetical protein